MFPASLPASGHSSLLLLATISRKCLPSALRCSLSAASKQALLFIVWAEREVLWGHGARERGEVSVQECAWASLWVDTGQMTERESLAEGSRGTPSNTSSPVSLPFPSLLSFPFCLSCPLTLSILVSSTQLAASLSAIKKTLYNQGGTVMGKQAHVRLLEHGKQQNPLLHLAAAGQKSPVSSTVSNLNSENPPDSKFEKQFTMTHQLLLCTLPSRLLPNRRIIFSRSCFGPTGGVIIFLALMPIQELLSSLIACLYNPFSSLWFHYQPN